MPRLLLILSALAPCSALAQDACTEASCVHPTADVSDSAVIGHRVTVDAGASVGDGTVLARRSVIGAGTAVGQDVGVAPLAAISTDTTVGDRVLIGLETVIGQDVAVGDDAVIGPFVSVGDRTIVEPAAVVARGVSVGDDASIGQSALIGPSVDIGDRATIGPRARIRKGVTVGVDAQISAGARVGRDVQIGRGVQIDPDTILRGDVIVGDWATVTADQYYPRGSVIPGVNAPPTIDSITVPTTLDLLSTAVLDVVVSDAQVGQPLTVSWTLAGTSGGWTLDQPTSTTPSLSVADGDSTPMVTVRVAVSDGTFETVAERTVAHRNDPPVIGDLVVPETLNMNASVQLLADASDPQGQDVALSWTLASPATGWAVTPSGELSVGGFGSAATATVRLTASDGFASASTQRSVTLVSDTPGTCADLQGTSAPSGVYTISPPGVAPFEVYCDLDTAGGGWTLISNRRANPANRESCGGRLMDFFTSGCGSPSAIAASQSFALDRTHRTSLPRTEMLVIQYLNGVPDNDDAYIVHLGSQSADLFPAATSVQHIPVESVCTLGGSCDSSNVIWKYIGDYWFHSGSCSSSSSGNLSLIHI